MSSQLFSLKLELMDRVSPAFIAALPKSLRQLGLPCPLTTAERRALSPHLTLVTPHF